MAKRIKSGIKRVEIAERNRLRNVAVKSEVKTRVKRVHEVMGNGGENASEVLKKAISTLDRAVKKGVLHQNTAARKKSRLVRQFNVSNA